MVRRERLSGHTLVEVILAASLLATVTLGVLAGFVATRSAAAHAEVSAQVTQRTSQALEALLALPFDDFASLAESDAPATFTIDDMGLPDPRVGRFEFQDVTGSGGRIYEVRAISEDPGGPGHVGFRVELVTRRGAQ